MTEGPTVAERKATIARIARKLAYGLSAIFLFVLAIQLIKSGAKALAPDLKVRAPRQQRDRRGGKLRRKFRGISIRPA